MSDRPVRETDRDGHRAADPGVPLYIPDAVLYEATRDAAALGALQILDWAQQNSEQVHTISTETFFNYIQSRETNAARREKDLGERAAIEAIHDGIHLAPGEREILITADDRVLRRVLVIETELAAAERRIRPYGNSRAAEDASARRHRTAV